MRISHASKAAVAVLAALMAGVITPARADAVDGYTIGGGPWNIRSCGSRVCPVVGSIPDGPIPDLICQSSGQEVYLGGTLQSVVWDKVRTASGTVGFVTDLAVLETPLGSFDARIPRCGGQPGQVAYYQPRSTEGDPVVAAPGIVIPLEEWSNGSCAPAGGAKFPDTTVHGRVTTLATWSLGRLGPTYLLRHHPDYMDDIDLIVMYDPGKHHDFFDQGKPIIDPPACDLRYDQNDLYRDWLAADDDNQLLILAGEVTRDDGSPHGFYGGINEALFQDIIGTPLRYQVLVCRYDDLDHPSVLREFAGVAAEGQRTSCPVKPGVAHYGWFHPGGPSGGGGGGSGW